MKFVVFFLMFVVTFHTVGVCGTGEKLNVVADGSFVSALNKLARKYSYSRYGDVTVSYYCNDFHKQFFASPDADLVVTSDPDVVRGYKDKSFNVLDLVRDRIVAVTSKNNAAASVIKRARHYDDASFIRAISSSHLIVAGLEGCGSGAHSQELVKEFLSRNRITNVQNDKVVMDLVRNGDGVGILAKSAVNGTEGLELHDFSYKLGGIKYSIILLRDNNGGRKFADFLLSGEAGQVLTDCGYVLA